MDENQDYPKKGKSQREKEKILINHNLQGWDIKTSRAFNLINSLYGNINRTLLQCLAKIVSNSLNIYLEREAQRRKDVLIKWFDDHYDETSQFLQNNILILDEKKKPIGNQGPGSKGIANQIQTND